MATNGKKSDEQLDREIDEVLQARQKRAAKAPPAATAAPRASPSQTEYEDREIHEAQSKLKEISRASLTDRKEAQADFLKAMRDPELVAERIGWLLDGNYGYGEMLMAKRILAATRMNRSAALSHMVGAFEWQCPQDMAVAAWKKLSKSEQAKLESTVQKVIRDAGKA